MPTTSTFWAAFYAGIAAPASLYAAAPAYDMYVTPLTPAQSFGVVGSYMSAALNEQSDVGRVRARTGG